jgi:hypothetical protein
VPFFLRATKSLLKSDEIPVRWRPAKPYFTQRGFLPITGRLMSGRENVP